MEKLTFKDIVPSSKDLFLMASGLLIFAIGYEMTSGGVSGVGALIYYVTKFPPSYTYFIINVALLLFALKILGLKYTIKTLLATAMVSLFIDLGQRLVPIDPVTGEPTKSSEWYSSCMLAYVYAVRRLGLI